MQHTSKLKIFVADDHPLLRAGLAQLISNEPDMEVCGEASDGASVLSLVAELRPDLVLLDVSLPNVSGTSLAEQLRDALPEVKVLALSAHEDRVNVRGMLAAGAQGYVAKRSSSEELIRAIRSVASGVAFIDPTVSKVFVEGISSRRSSGSDQALELSEREAQVLQLIARGHAMKEIATMLAVGVRTVETYRTRGMEKAGLTSRADIISFALEQGWLAQAPESRLESP